MIQKLFPFLRWWPITGENLRADLIAGITVALVLIPQSMAYAQLAGLPAYYGLYAAFLPGIIAALWGSSNQLATGPVAVVSLLTASALMPFATLGSEQFVALAILLALLVGLFQLSLGLLRLGVVVNFLSHPVIVGFTNAAALIIGLSQLNKIFGVDKPRSESFANDVLAVLAQIPESHLPTLAMGLAAIGVMLYMKAKVPKFPGVLVAVVATTVVSFLIGFAEMGGSVVGEIPAGLPSVAMPVLDMSVLGTLISSAVVISLVGFMEAISIAKAMAAKTKDHIDPNQELIGQGLGNIFGSFTQSYPTSGSFSRSAVNLNAGARTGLSAVITGLVVMTTLLFLTPLLYHLPSAVLAAVIMMAVFGLVNFRAVVHAWQANKHDGTASVVTFVATLGFAPHLDKGIMVGAVLAILLYLYRTMRPRVAILGRYGDGTLRDLKVHPELPTDPRIIAVRFDGSLYFANVSYFEDAILEAVSCQPSAKFVLVVGDGINQVDASGEEVLHHLVERLKDAGVTLVFSGLKRQVLEVMRHTSLYETIGRDCIYATETMALNAIYEWLKRDDADGTFGPLKPQSTDVSA
ncbi:SulP family inorganic anion transporter [Thiohalomonas denitrificans]|uniref:SulP family inorganic anion transporter n=1 Tax=Thiohalomonas denitrificans TaxID=415747 RepID=UPI0026EF34B1|nr:sulfate permease [Thiohalomonas denitrificans]